MILLEGFELDPLFLSWVLVPSQDLDGIRRIGALELYFDFLTQLADQSPDIVDRNTVLGARIECANLLEMWSDKIDVPTELAAAITAFRQNTLAASNEFDLSFGTIPFLDHPGFGHAASWKRLLGHWIDKPNLRFLEVGTFEGRAACWLLQNILTDSSSELVCIDDFSWALEAPVVTGIFKNLFDVCGFAGTASSSEAFDNNIAAIGAQDRVVKKVGKTRDELKKLGGDSFDMIYLDCASGAPEQLEDLALCWPLLKENGFLFIDDYGGPHEWEEGVRRATDSFFSVFADEYECVESGFQFVVQKKQPSTQ